MQNFRARFQLKRLAGLRIDRLGIPWISVVDEQLKVRVFIDAGLVEPLEWVEFPEEDALSTPCPQTTWPEHDTLWGGEFKIVRQEVDGR